MLARVMLFEQRVGPQQVLCEQVGGCEPCLFTSLPLTAAKYRLYTS